MTTNGFRAHRGGTLPACKRNQRNPAKKKATDTLVAEVHGTGAPVLRGTQRKLVASPVDDILRFRDIQLFSSAKRGAPLWLAGSGVVVI